MQWDGTQNAGFTPPGPAGKPWLPLAPDYQSVNAAAQNDDPSSLLSFYRNLLRLRRTEPALTTGEIEFLVPGDDDCLAYRRSAKVSLIVALNLARHERSPAARWPEGVAVFGTHRQAGEAVQPAEDRLQLAPYEVLIYRTGVDSRGARQRRLSSGAGG